MYWFKFMPSILLEPEYNCSDLPPEEWSKQYGTKQYVFGIWSLFFGTSCMLLYFPAFVVFTRERALTCFKIMQFHIIVDIFGIIATSILFGILLLKGAVFCSDPILTIITGSMAYVLISSRNLVRLFRRLSSADYQSKLRAARSCSSTQGKYYHHRICNKSNLSLVKVLGWRSTAVLMCAIVYGICMPMFTRPYLVNSRRLSFFKNPFIPGREAHVFINIPHDIHNVAAIVLIPVLYLVFCLILCKYSPSRSTELSQKSASLTAPVFTQASIISFIYVSGAIIFIIMDILPMPQEIVTFGMIGFQCLHGSPSIIYLVLNRPVRTYALSLCGQKSSTNHVNITVAASTTEFMPHILLEPSYNCSDHTPEEWSALYGTNQFAFGMWSLVFGTSCIILYLPSFVVFTRERVHTCLKIMQFHIVIDVLGTFATSILFGILILKGSVYCSDPILNTIASTLAYGIWCTSFVVSLLLITNRICELLNRGHLLKARLNIPVCEILKKFIDIDAALVFISTGLAQLGGADACDRVRHLFTRPCSINSRRACFFRNPFIPGHEPHEYASVITHDIHSGTAAALIPLLYLVFCIIVCKLSPTPSAEISQKSTTLTARVFTQASIVSFIFVTGGIIFIIMDHFPMPQEIISFGMIGCQCLHGILSIIYLVMNRQVRSYASSLFWKNSNTVHIEVTFAVSEVNAL
ncbi:hypothetical protein PRIPAC_82542 [Pristionchus pacificus]|uniref:G protein-coupled receptor n=1 Tax=Pristionchus pacificus TaxID=54126 RepID=A0A2A6CMZ5_PRIPA|nr:hypothetical protein PRIPAC_82542 [Pristionchus pacificus]|eukprot:PDM79470.1 G protein-coupled receptor [Pristionchus pacificus]